MINSDLFNQAGDHAVNLQGEAGSIEGVITGVASPGEYLAVLGHPHSLQGGSMNNKVVTTLARAMRDLNIPSLRFNFRGVGQSDGDYADGIGEAADMLLVIEQLSQVYPHKRLILAGFSFGSYVTYRAAALSDSKLLISVAPPVHHYDYSEFDSLPPNWLIIQGLNDEVVPAKLVQDFSKQRQLPNQLVEFADTGHFFHGKLIKLRQVVSDYIQDTIDELS